MHDDAPPSTRLDLLGGFRLWAGREEMATTGPAERLLVELAVRHRGRPVRRTTLAERLWPDAPAGRATASLRSVLWRLPRHRGRAPAVGDASTVRLAPHVQVDLWRSEEMVSRCRADDPPAPADGWRELLEHDLLPECDEPWLVAERESHRQHRLHALERCAAAWRRAGRLDDALTAAFAAVLAEPLRESAHREVIEVHLAEGNHAEALLQYHSYRAVLDRELGLPPSDVIRSLVAPLLGRPADRGRRPRRTGPTLRP